MLFWTIFICGALLGGLMPTRWGAMGFLGAATLLFGTYFAINVASGFEGSSLEESLLLFNGSYLSYLGFNGQITYRAFALPLFALALPYIYRAQR